MGSKTPLQTARLLGQTRDKAEDLGLSGCSATHLRVHRIAAALQVPQSVLYDPPHAVAPARSADGDAVPSTKLDQDGEALLHAYQRIQDPAERRRLLSFVQAIAERS